MDELDKRVRSSRREFGRSVAGAAFLSIAEKSGVAKGSLPLAVRGKEPYFIFLSSEASPSERWAADELRDHIEQITGIRLRIDLGGLPVADRAIAIGRSALLEKLAIEAPDGEACVLATAGETVIIAGGRERGTMYGVSIFLEKLGCRWFTPDIARIPRKQALWLPEFHEVHRPAFEYREVFFTEAQGREWSARNRLNGHFHQLDERVGGKVAYMPFAHSFYELVPPDAYFAGHPEYFALVDGKRRRDGSQLCLTNAEVLRLAVAQAEEWLAAHPEVSIVSVSQNDGGGWCECEPCRRVVKEEGAISGLALRFVNQVAERLAVSHPGKIVDMLAYQETADPPGKVRPRSNVQIRLCPIEACQGHSYTSCVYNRQTRERLKGWSRIAPRLHLWQYSVNFSHYLIPFPNYDELISDLPMFRRAGVSGVFVEGAISEGGRGDDAELRSYLAARLLWNPELDARTEIREFLDGVYGPASALLWQYFELRQQAVRRGEHLWIDQNVDARYLTPDLLKHGRALLGRALRISDTDGSRRRIERQLLSLDYVETVRERRAVIQGAFYGPADPERLERDMQELVKTAEELGVTQFREGYTIARQAADWDDLKARSAAIVLTGGALEATVVPELDGRIIAFGRPNILRVADPGEWAYPHAGGIHLRVFDGSAGELRIAWRVESATREAVTLTGSSQSGVALQMQIGLAGGTLGMHAALSNRGDSPACLRMFWRAEFACGLSRTAELTYRDRSGERRTIGIKDSVDGGGSLSDSELPEGEWALASESPSLRVRNRFATREVERCAFNWSFRGSAGLSVGLTVESAETEVTPGGRLVLTNEFSSL